MCEVGVLECMDKEGEVYDGFEIVVNGKWMYINLQELIGGKMVMCYG